MIKRVGAPRLKVLMARNAPYAVIIRRGPTNHVCTIGWDRENDDFQVGQWLKGRIYAERSDLSPDGRHLVYFAGHHNWNTETKGTWTAVSRAPYIKAISLWPKGDSTHGGGLFLDEKTVLIHGAHRDALHISPDVRAVDDNRTWGQGKWTKTYQPPDGIERVDNVDAYLTDTERQIYADALATKTVSFRILETYRRGWRLNKSGQEGGNRWWLGRHLTQDWWLRRPYKGLGYQLIHRETADVIDLPKSTTWAESNDWGQWENSPTNMRLVWTLDGKLFAGAVTPEGLGEPQMLFDFNPMQFERVIAPY